MKKYLIAAILLTLPALSFAADKPAKASVCAVCHGQGGGAPIVNNYPKLKGQNKDYLISALKAYRAGERKGGLSAVMTGQATSLSDADIDALSAYYSSK